MSGRPTLYRSDYPDLARRLCLLGGTNDELASFFEVSRSTIDEWLRVHPEFAEAVRKGRDIIDMALDPSVRKDADTCTFSKRFLQVWAGGAEWSVAELRPSRVREHMSYLAGPSRSDGSTR